jgi:hypothetical protein
MKHQSKSRQLSTHSFAWWVDERGVSFFISSKSLVMRFALVWTSVYGGFFDMQMVTTCMQVLADIEKDWLCAGPTTPRHIFLSSAFWLTSRWLHYRPRRVSFQLLISLPSRRGPPFPRPLSLTADCVSVLRSQRKNHALCVSLRSLVRCLPPQLNNRSQNKTSPRHAQKPFQKGGYQIRQVPYTRQRAHSQPRE